jgi:hypothetical protein
MNINKTKTALNSSFLTSNNKINFGYLVDSIELILNNTERLYIKLKNKRMKTHSIIWLSFMELAQELLNNEEYPKKYIIDSNHLKQWLKDYGYDYKTCFIELIENTEKERQELYNMEV